jgi:hypothetical protein
MLEMMAELLAILLGLIKKGDTQQAQKRINNAYRDFLKQDAVFFDAISADEMINELLEKHDYTNDHLNILSQLFYVEGEVSIKTQNQERGKLMFAKALKILNYLDQTEANFSLERNNRIQQVSDRLNQLSVSDTNHPN